MGKYLDIVARAASEAATGCVGFDLWDLYLDEESMREAARRWPPGVFMLALLSPRREALSVGSINTAAGTMELKIVGEIRDAEWAPLTAEIAYPLRASDFTPEQRRRLLGIIRCAYPGWQTQAESVPRRASRALGVP